MPSMLHHRAGSWRRELGLFAAAYLTYSGVRAVTEGSTGIAFENARSLIHLERDLGIFWEGRVQDAVLGSRLLGELANAVYVTATGP